MISNLIFLPEMWIMPPDYIADTLKKYKHLCVSSIKVIHRFKGGLFIL